jgi:GNAT superfamily N-acetyltransferase
MNPELQINILEKPDDAAWEVIGGGITAFNLSHAGSDAATPLCIVLRDESGQTLGGVIGDTYYGWLSVSLMFVKEELRGQGYGEKLLLRAEEEARLRGVKNVFLDTFSFQAPDFYQKLGYRIFGELADFPPGHTRHYLTKRL